MRLASNLWSVATRLLLLVVLLTAAAAVGPAHAYLGRAGEVYAVPAADRVSAKQLFAREAEIFDSGLGYIKMDIDLPGRVYIRHVENASAVAAGLFGRVRVSGDTQGAVQYARLPESTAYLNGLFDEFMLLSLHDRHSTSQAESLLVEVEFYHKNVLKRVTAGGSGDVVVLADVVYAAQDGKVMPGGTELNAYMSGDDNAYKAGPGRLFVSDPTARWTSSSLSVITAYGTAGGNAVQIDVASINSTDEALWVYAQANSNVTLFAAESVSPIAMINTTSRNLTAPRNPLCVATKRDVNLTASTIIKDTATSVVIPGGSTCVKLPLPPCEPVPIRDNIDSANPYRNAAQTATPAPNTSAAARQRVAGGVAAGMLLSVLLPLLS